MFHKVNVLNPRGKIKKIISRRELSKMHWKIYYQSEEKISLTTSATPRIPRWVKEKLDLEYPSYFDASSLL